MTDLPSTQPSFEDPWDTIPDGTYHVQVVGAVRPVHVTRTVGVVVEFPGGPGSITRPDLVEQMAAILHASDDKRIGMSRHDQRMAHTLVEITNLLDLAGVSQEGDVIARMRRALRLEEW